jgi:hypothetical protein
MPQQKTWAGLAELRRKGRQSQIKGRSKAGPKREPQQNGKFCKQALRAKEKDRTGQMSSSFTWAPKCHPRR